MTHGTTEGSAAALSAAALDGWVDVAGDSAQPAIVLLHASALNRRMWIPVTATLEADFRLLAPDLPGHGALRAERFTLESAVARVQSLLRGLPAPALVAGDSLGGYVAMAAAAASPADAAGVVAGGCTLNPTGVVALALRRLGWQTRLTAMLRGRTRSVAAEEELLRRTHPCAAIDEMIDLGLSPSGRAEGLLACAGVDFSRLISAYRRPVVFVNGADDVAARRDEERFRRMTPQATTITIPGGAHGVSLSQPERFAAIIRDAARAAGHRAPPGPSGA